MACGVTGSVLSWPGLGLKCVLDSRIWMESLSQLARGISYYEEMILCFALVRIPQGTNDRLISHRHQGFGDRRWHHQSKGAGSQR